MKAPPLLIASWRRRQKQENSDTIDPVERVESALQNLAKKEHSLQQQHSRRASDAPASSNGHPMHHQSEMMSTMMSHYLNVWSESCEHEQVA